MMENVNLVLVWVNIAKLCLALGKAYTCWSDMLHIDCVRLECQINRGWELHENMYNITQQFKQNRLYTIQ